MPGTMRSKPKQWLVSSRNGWRVRARDSDGSRLWWPRCWMAMDGKDIRKNINQHQPTSFPDFNLLTATWPSKMPKTAPGSPKPADFFEELRMQQLSKVFDHKDRMVGWWDGWDGMGWPQKSPTCLQFFPTLAIESSCPTCNWQLFFGFWALLGRRLSCWRGWAKHRRLWLAQCARCDERGWWKHFAKHVLTQQHFFQVRLYIAFEVTTWETGRCEVAAW